MPKLSDILAIKYGVDSIGKVYLGSQVLFGEAPPEPEVSLALAASTFKAFSGVTSAVSDAISTHASGSLLFCVTSYGSATPTGVSDNYGNSWTQVTTNPFLRSGLCAWIAPNANGGVNHKATVQYSGTEYPTVFFGEIVGAELSNPLDGSFVDSTYEQTSPFVDSMAVQAGKAEIILAAITHGYDPTDFSPDSSFTLIGQNVDSDNYWTGALAYKIVPVTSSTEGITWTVSGITGFGGAARKMFSLRGVIAAPRPTLGGHDLDGQMWGYGTSHSIAGPITTQTTGSSFLYLDSSTVVDSEVPIDSKGNVLVKKGASLDWDGWADWDMKFYVAESGVGGANHTVTKNKPNDPQNENTLVIVEIKNSQVLQDFTLVQRASAAQVTSGQVTATGKALLVAVWSGTGGEETNVATVVDPGWTIIEEYSSWTGGTGIQTVVAVKEVPAGTYDVTWSASPTQGANLGLFAFQ